jgi:hypothetical protein
LNSPPHAVKYVKLFLKPDTPLLAAGRLHLSTLFLLNGYTIVSLILAWEKIATFLLNWPQRLFSIRLFRKIAETPVQFKQPSDPHS